MIDYLKHINIFSELTEGDIKLLVNYCSFKTLEKDEILFNAGDIGNELYIVIEGMIVGHIKLLNGTERTVATIGPGDFVGEIAIFDNVPRSATCNAAEKTGLLSITKKDFMKLVDHYPVIANTIMYKMLNITIERLRESSNFLADVVEWGEEARKRTITDELTGIYNRRFLDDALVDTYNNAKKNGTVFCLIMMDIDYFRELNNTYGHELGDAVMREIVTVYTRHLGEDDIIARFGGDEFTILMPGRDNDAAYEIITKIRTAVEALKINCPDGSEKTITISQGLASFPHDALDLKGLREKADTALYLAKEGGRNRVVRAE